MWTYDGRTFDAPRFRFGMDPCGAMYSTVLDLGRFMSVLFAKGDLGGGKAILKPQTLEAMWTPQFAAKDAKRGFGIGFAVNELEGQRWVGHDGAVYGFATTLMALPDDGLGVVAVATKDGANAVIDQIAISALRMMLARKDGKPLPEPKVLTDIDPAEARAMAGRYAKDDVSVDLEEREGKLFVSRSDDDVTLRLRRDGTDLVTDDVIGHGTVYKVAGDKLTQGDAVFTQAEAEEACARERQVQGAHRRVRLGPQHALRLREGRQAVDAHRVVHRVPARAGEGRPVPLPEDRALRRREGALQARRLRARHRSGGGERRLEAAQRRRRGAGGVPDQATASGGRTHRGCAEGNAAEAGRQPAADGPRRADLARPLDPPRHPLRGQRQLPGHARLQAAACFHAAPGRGGAGARPQGAREPGTRAAHP